ncbi:iron ABC transporter permease [Orbaceae bacterium ESL0727]|nr:iron ABC transporter permease [Orbaceae bacterium ESL0727]
MYSPNAYRVICSSVIGLTILLMLFSLGLGHYFLSLQQIIAILVSPVYQLNGAISDIDMQVIWQIRLPRILSAFFVGGGLALSGAVLQGVFYNPLVDPHVIGVTSGSAFGGTLAILLGFSTFGLLTSAFCFGLLALILIFVITATLKQQNILILVLVGVILSGFFSALVSLVQYFADSEETLPNIIFWLLGSFATANWQKFLILVIPVSIASFILIRLSFRINVLSLADNEAKSLGISVIWTRSLVLILCAIIVAVQVAICGSIGWVGLIIPHAARMLVGANHQRLLPIAFWLGGLYMILVDDIARLIATVEVPLGIITALLGAPCFVLLLKQQALRKE